jgi:Cadherin-like/FG-GAP-like repeat
MNSGLPTLLSSQQPASDDDDFNVVGDEILATFSPWASWLNDGNAFAPAPLLPASADGSATLTNSNSGVAVTSGGITINVIYDAAALAAPASFRAGIQQAVSIMAAAISDKITVNIKVDYSGTGHGAAAGPDHGLFQSYSSIRADLINNATPGDTAFAALAAGSSIQGQSNVAVWNAQLKLWGLMGANDLTTDDGSATFATDIDPNLLVGVALHELTHAMGRIPYGPQPDIFDLYRFTSAGTRLFQGGATAPSAYFSLDGGNTKVADYGKTSDPSDFLNSGVQGAADPFNEFYNGGTSQQLTTADLRQLDALGFHLMAADSIAPALVHDSAISLAVGGTATIAASQLQFDDNLSTHAQETYTVLTAPTHGTLLKSGSATTSFTQADIDNGLIAYHETGNLGSPDSFTFRIMDAAGNAAGPAQFQINLDHAPVFAPSAFELSAFAPGAGGWSSQDQFPRELADVNGDGAADIVGFGAAGAYVSLAKGDGSFAPFSFALAQFGASAGGWSSQDHFPRQLADVNGDGMADIVGFGAAGVYVSLATGGGSFGPLTFALSQFGTSAGGWSSQDQFPRELADVNGDGMADIVGFGGGGVYVSLAAGGGSFGPVSFRLGQFGASAGGWSSQDQFPRELADVNGDHMADIVGFGGGGVYVSLATGGGSFAPLSLALGQFGTTTGWSSDHQFPRELADIDGDGKIDIVGFGGGGVNLALGHGDGSFGPLLTDIQQFGAQAGGWASQDQYPRQLADVNHDGAADIIGFGYAGVYEALSNHFHLV